MKHRSQTIGKRHRESRIWGAKCGGGPPRGMQGVSARTASARVRPSRSLDSDSPHTHTPHHQAPASSSSPGPHYITFTNVTHHTPLDKPYFVPVTSDTHLSRVSTSTAHSLLNRHHRHQVDTVTTTPTTQGLRTSKFEPTLPHIPLSPPLKESNTSLYCFAYPSRTAGSHPNARDKQVSTTPVQRTASDANSGPFSAQPANSYPFIHQQLPSSTPPSTRLIDMHSAQQFMEGFNEAPTDDTPNTRVSQLALPHYITFTNVTQHTPQIS